MSDITDQHNPDHHDLLSMLTPAQRAAVTTIAGPVLILAGPGSGKTRVVTHRVAYILRQGVPGRQVLAMTFTNKAADEMKRRLELLAPGQNVWVSTFHRFCGSLLRRYGEFVGLGSNFTIYDTGDSLQLLKETIRALPVQLTHVTPERIQQAISWAKNSLILPEQYESRPGHPIGNLVKQIYPAYQKALLSANAVDFDDMLLHVAQLLREQSELRAALDERYRYIMVDEYQDTNLAQYMIVRGMSIDYPNLAVTGDPDQSIYGWRGANLNNILDFEQDYPQVAIVRLEQNYRSTKAILRAADALISHNKKRKAKSLFTDNDEGAAVTLTRYSNQQHEADAIAVAIAQAIQKSGRRARDFAIFYRMNALSRTLEHALREQGVPYQLVRGVEFYQRKEVKDLLAYLQLLNNPRDLVAFRRIVNLPARGISKTTVDAIEQYANLHGLGITDAARQAGLIAELNKRAMASTAKFMALFDQLQLAREAPVEEVLGQVLSLTGYDKLYAAADPEDEERLANIQELLSAAAEFDAQHPDDGGLEQFLEQACLTNDIDGWETEVDRVSLMTLHAAKGLEFPVVYLIAVEEGLLPHERSRHAADELEEERRLLFVGMTRAQAELHLSTAQMRTFRGQTRMTIPSMFLLELPSGEIHVRELTWLEQDDGHADHIHEDFEERVIPVRADLQTILESKLERIAQYKLQTAAELAVAENGPGGNGGHHLSGESGAEGSAVTAPDSPARETPPPRVPPEAFAHGMVVLHPEYGLGKITALSGRGIRRTATVKFATGAGEKKFLLAHAPLRPAKE
ncbi:MAG: 3'-5' exonuclease [Pirellulales bacterium]|nr:3'-5' exonuclease [Pirellulales bacterium]